MGLCKEGDKQWKCWSSGLRVVCRELERDKGDGTDDNNKSCLLARRIFEGDGGDERRGE